MTAPTPSSTDKVQQLIEQEFDKLSPELQRAARWITQHRAAMALHSMRGSAREAGVTPATMTRLAQRLGYEGFEAFRLPFVKQFAGAQAVSSVSNRSVRVERETPDRRAVLNALQQANVVSARKLNSDEALDQAARTILGAERVYFLGLRVSHGVAFHLSYAYGLLAANGALINDIGGTMADQVTQLGTGDVLVTVCQSPYTRQTVESVNLARNHGARVIALTDGPLSPVARKAQQSLFFETASTAYLGSVTGAQALTESLLAAISVRGGQRAQKRLREMNNHLRETRAYWERDRAGSAEIS